MNPFTTIYMQYRTIYDIVNIVADNVLVRSGPTPSLDATLILIYRVSRDAKLQEMTFLIYDDVIKWWHFPRYWPLVWGIHRGPMNSPHKDQWRESLMFSLICAWTNSWLNKRDAGVLRRHRAYYDVSVMRYIIYEIADHHELTSAPHSPPPWAPGCSCPDCPHTNAPRHCNPSRTARRRPGRR